MPLMIPQEGRDVLYHLHLIVQSVLLTHDGRICNHGSLVKFKSLLRMPRIPNAENSESAKNTERQERRER